MVPSTGRVGDVSVQLASSTLLSHRQSFINGGIKPIRQPIESVRKEARIMPERRAGVLVT